MKLPTFLRNIKKRAELKKRSDQDYDYWRKLYEDAKNRKLGKNRSSFDIFLEKYFPNISEIEDEDDFVTRNYRISKRRDKEFVDTISWLWFDVSEDETNQNISQEYLSNSSEISENIFLENDFYCSTMRKQ